MAVKDALAEKTSRKNEAVKLTKNMSIADMIKAMEPEIKKALPQVITPERFTRMALSALNTTPKLAEWFADVLPRGTDERSTAWAGTKHAAGTGVPDPVQKQGKIRVSVPDRLQRAD